MKTHKFIKENGGWYIDLPEYIEQGGSKGDLAMVAGADTMLDIIAKGENKVTFEIDTKEFKGSDLIELTERCEPSMGGGYYFMPRFEEKEVSQRMWLCGVTNFVFGDLPEKIYIKKVG